jgi:riboflavin kinase/FMN adenylyltransferase
VVHGRAVGRSLGARTANVLPDHEILPPDGVYAARAVLRGKEYPSVCYIGSRPTFSPSSKKKNVEVHLFNYSGSLYGRKLEVIFLKMLRKDKKFPSPAALAAQIRKDIKAARSAFSRH